MTQRNEIDVGILHSLTGAMSVSEKPLVDFTLMAIEEINQTGGVLGREVVAHVEDGASSPSIFAKRAEKLMAVDQVATIFGCWTSSSRKAVKPVVEANDGLLWYPVQYEGLEQSDHIVYTGSCLNQQIEPAVEWIFGLGYRRAILIGSDYVFPRTTNRLIQRLIQYFHGKVLDELYTPVGEEDFSEFVSAIRTKQPDIIFNTVNGRGNLMLFKILQDNGIKCRDLPVMSFSFSETELKEVAEAAKGSLACWSYFQSIDNSENARFISRIKRRFGDDAVASCPAMLAYCQPFLWKALAEKAGSVSCSASKFLIPGLEFYGPGGRIRIQHNHHTAQQAIIGQANAAGQFDILWQSNGFIQPDPWFGAGEIYGPRGYLVRKVLSSYPDSINNVGMLAEQKIKLEESKRALKARSEALANSNKALEDIIHVISSDLEIQIAEVVGSADLLGENYADELDNGGREIVEKISRLTNDMGTLLRELRYVLEISRTTPSIEAVDIGKVIAGVIRTLHDVLVENHATVTVAEDMPTVNCDAEQVGEIFRILVQNAIRYNRNRQKIISIGIADTSKSGAQAFFVRDNGIGIPARYHEDIYSLSLVPRPVVPVGHSRGFGLTVVKKIIEAHGGRIWLTSDENIGSTFYFTLQHATIAPTGENH